VRIECTARCDAMRRNYGSSSLPIQSQCIWAAHSSTVGSTQVTTTGWVRAALKVGPIQRAIIPPTE